MRSREPEVIDLTDKEPDSREWQDVEKYLEKFVANIVRGIMTSEREEEQEEENDLDARNDELTELIRQGLERYRTEPPESNKRKYIDGLIRIHGKSKLSKIDGRYKNRHNALILEFIISKPMSRNQIMKRLGMGTSYSKYELQLEKGIAELADIMERIL